MSRVWLITGASSGFGRAVTEIVLKRGDIAVATHRGNLSTLEALITTTDPERLLVLKCDVTHPEDVSAAFDKTIAKFGRCDVVFNNAGYGILGEIESTPVEEARKMFEVNFWGAANVSREAVRVFREVNPPGRGGRLLNMSSGGGFVGAPALGYYCATKHALEGLTESLAKEIDPAWNIKISILAPGSFKTRAHNESLITCPPISPYTNPNLPSQGIRQFFAKGVIHGNVVRAAERIFDFSLLEDPPMRWAVGKDSVEGTREKVKSVVDELDQFESWAEGLVD